MGESRARGNISPLVVIVVLVSVSTRAATADGDDQVPIDVVESPERGTVLAAAVRAAGAAGRLGVLEPGEALDAGARLCAGRGVAVGGAAGLGAGGAGAAARAGRPLLLVEEAPGSLPAARRRAALELWPDEAALGAAGAALAQEKGWRRAVLLHTGPASRAALLAPDPDVLELPARALPLPGDEALLRNLLLVLKKAGASNFIVWCSAACCACVLAAARGVGLLADKHSYLLLTLDLHTQPLDSYSHGGANITTLRLFDPTAAPLREMVDAWRREYEGSFAPPAAGDDGAEGAEGASQYGEEWAPPTALVLAHDATRFTLEALRRLQLPAWGDAGWSGDCASGQAALHADTLLNYIRSEEWTGLAGAVRWAAGGVRAAPRLQLAELTRVGLQPAGRWTPGEGVGWTRRGGAPIETTPDSMTNRTFTVIIALASPYVMIRESAERLSGNQRYEGFCIELIEKLAEQLSFNFTLMEQPDGLYGTLDNTTNTWSGMMHRLMTDPEVDFAITDLTITAEREQAVDFTTPFMNLGISVLFRKPKEPEPAFFAFMMPFSTGVWLWLGAAYVGTSLVLYVVGRLSPEEWQNPYPCVEEPSELHNQFTLANALWFNLGAVLLQGSEIAPVAYSTRAVASVWWVFALVITSSYTANLATLLAKKTSTEVLHGVGDLVHPPPELTINYGAKQGGSTYTFFQYSQNKLYREMFEYMKTQQMPLTNADGIQRVMAEEYYAFLMESTTIEYVTQRECNITQIGGLLDNKGYGIAMKKQSPYRQALNLALLNLQERGVLREMKHKWWNELHGGGACKGDEEQESESLKMANFLGLFVVLVGGCALGVVAACAELAWTARARGRPGASYPRRLLAELRFVFQFERVVKPLHPQYTPTPTPSPPTPPSPPLPLSPTESLRSGRSRWSSRRRRSSMAVASARRFPHTEH